VCLFKHNKSINNCLVSINFRVTVIIYSLYNIYPTKTLYFKLTKPSSYSVHPLQKSVSPSKRRWKTYNTQLFHFRTSPSRSWSYGSWICNYLCNQCPSPLILWAWTPLRRGVLDTALCDKVCQWLTVGRCFSLGTPVSSTNKTDRQDITEIFLKVALNTINLIQSISKGVVFSIKIGVLLRNKIFPNVMYDCADGWCHIGL
jgi:hypothetical protein